MNCPNCQTPNRDGGKFCIRCGYELPQVQPAPAAPVWQDPAPAYMPVAPQAGYPVQTSFTPAAPVYAPPGPASPQAPASQGQPLPAPGYSPAPPAYVVVTDINMTFSSMVVFMVKWAIAALPALIILSLILLLIMTIFGGVIGGILGVGMF
jgi:hypothetical protein